MFNAKCLFSTRHRKLFLNVLVVSLSFCVRRHHRSRPLREENAEATTFKEMCIKCKPRVKANSRYHLKKDTVTT